MQDTYLLLVELFCYAVLVSSVWKNAGMTISHVTVLYITDAVNVHGIIVQR